MFRRVLVLYSVVDAVRYGEATDILTDLETPATAEAIAVGLRTHGWVAATAPVRGLEDVERALCECDPAETLVFNQCETLGGESRGEPLVPRAVEARGFLCVGADHDNLALCLDKAAAKRRLVERGVPTAPFLSFDTPAALRRWDGRTNGVSFPALVKPAAEDCSLGLTPDSVVHNAGALRARVQYLFDTYRQGAVVEPFLTGSEFTAALWGNEAAQGEAAQGEAAGADRRGVEVVAVSQVDFSSCPPDQLAFDHFEAKWSNRFPTVYPAPIDTETRTRIESVARQTYRAVGCRDYARVDMREHEGVLYVIDVNPNPGLAPDAGFARGARLLGYDYAGLANRLVQIAIERL